jgi:HK97 family phage major capsid protein
MKFTSREELAEFVRAEAVRAVTPAALPHVTTGPVGRDSAGYSYSRAAALAAGAIEPGQAKEEARMSERLRKIYPHTGDGRPGLLVPLSGSLIPDRALGAEITEMTIASSRKYDPDEDAWVRARVAGYDKKALSAASPTAGGSLIGPEQLNRDFIDIQRATEVFSRAGATSVPMGPDGTLSLPTLSASSTAYWIGEGDTITESEPTTGSLSFAAKKVAVLVKLRNELLRFGGSTVEQIIRTDMARTAAGKIDVAMLEGAGGTSIKGLTTYGAIRVIAASGAGANGDTFAPADVGRMIGQLPDGVEPPLTWVMRRQMFAAVCNRRADAVAANDGRGAFLFNGSQQSLLGYPVLVSNNVSGTRAKGSSNSLTYILLGHFPDWIIARLGVMEFLATGIADTDSTQLRAIQHIDAAPSRPTSFAFCDQLNQA